MRRTLSGLSKSLTPLTRGASKVAEFSPLVSRLALTSSRLSSTLPQPPLKPKNPKPIDPAVENLNSELDPDTLNELQNRVFESLERFSGTVSISACAAIPMVILSRFMMGARKNQSYSETYKEIEDLKLDQVLRDAILMMKRRSAASLAPAEATKFFALSSTQSVLFSSFIETIISGLPGSQTSEAYQRFRMINGSNFGFIDPKENLLEIDEHKFKYYLEKAQDESEIINKKATWENLQKLQNNFKANIPYQTLFLATRNITFAAGVFTAKALASNFVLSNPDLFGFLGFDIESNPKAAIECCTIFNRILFAILTTPLDNALTKLSSGEMNFEEFRKMDASSKVSFRGALARTAFVFSAFCTIAYGEEGGEFLKNVIADSPIFKIILEQSIKASNDYYARKTGFALEETIVANVMNKLKQEIQIVEEVKLENINKLSETLKSWDQDISLSDQQLLASFAEPDLSSVMQMDQKTFSECQSIVRNFVGFCLEQSGEKKLSQENLSQKTDQYFEKIAKFVTEENALPSKQPSPISAKTTQDSKPAQQPAK